MRTYQEFVAEAYNREYDRRGPRPVRGRDYEDFKGLPKPSGNLGGQFQSKDKRPSVHPAAHLKPKKKSAAERMDAAGKRLGLPEDVELDETLDSKFGSMRKRGGRSAPPEERSVGGEMNRKNKDYWADSLGKNRDRGKGSKAKRRAAKLGEENVQELFITRKSPEQKADEKRKKKVAELIRLMKHAKDTHTDVARKTVAK